MVILASWCGREGGTRCACWVEVLQVGEDGERTATAPLECSVCCNKVFSRPDRGRKGRESSATPRGQRPQGSQRRRYDHL